MKQMSDRGFELIPMATDGNCLFRAIGNSFLLLLLFFSSFVRFSFVVRFYPTIALQVYGDAEMHDTVRQQCVKHMLAERDHYSQFISEDFTEYSKNILMIFFCF